MSSVPGPADPDDLADELLAAGRTLLGIVIASIAAAPVEITVLQHRVLVLLAAEGARTVGELAAELGVNASNATRHCDRLEKLGLASRRRSTTDARVVRVALTPAGHRLLETVSHRRRNEVLRVLERMPAREQVAAVQALEAFNAAAHEHGGAEWVAPPEISPLARSRTRRGTPASR